MNDTMRSKVVSLGTIGSAFMDIVQHVTGRFGSLLRLAGQFLACQ